MYAWQQSNFAGNLPDLIERAAIRTAALVQNVVAEIFLAQPLERAFGQRALLFILFRNGLDNLFLERIHQVIAFLLGMLLSIYRIVQPVAIFLGNFFVQSLIERQRLDFHLRRINFLEQFLYSSDDLF